MAAPVNRYVCIVAHALEFPRAHPLELVSNRTLPAVAIIIYRTRSRPAHSTAEEVWQWIDMQTPEEGTHMTGGSHTERQRKSRHSKACRVGSPFLIEMLKERQKAMEAAASLSGSDLGSYKRIQEELEQSESEQESELSHTSEKTGPDVTPGTSDCII
ncbi:hypothetical protein NDU88_003736 [Pleurodeles waltl]|uniref:Uncharacterized protein n=1 Tax=Pleurodeles waltl TaxID=8319 RepID=A0AAV7MRG6_PLEWA|nr:hypothetical protein NDU88_003736 [Pleurodeles waltl]